MTKWLLLPALLLAVAASGQEDAFRSGVALRDAVNIRSRPSLEAEVLGQLQRGDPFRAVGEVPVADRAPGDPALWYIIKLPDPVRVWLPAARLAPSGNAVNVAGAVLYSGPGESFEKVGELAPGAGITVLALEGDWAAIRPPPDLFGFVAENQVNVEAPVTRAVPLPSSPPAPLTPTPTPRAASPAGAAIPVALSPPAPIPVPEPAPPSTGPSEIRRLLDEAGPPRIVRREGRLARARNIQAPGHFLLRDVRTGRVMNFLHGERFEDRRWRDMVGRVVVVEGREFLDARWPRLPVLEAERVELIR